VADMYSLAVNHLMVFSLKPYLAALVFLAAGTISQALGQAGGIINAYRLLGHNGEEGLFGLNYDRVDGSGTLLFDEIEKAHERVLDLFLQLLSAARITLGSGRVLNLEKFYVAATSNIGSPLLIGSKTNVRETLVRRVIQEARDQMRPEIFDRFDRVLVFNRLSYEVQIEVGRLHLQWEIEAQERRGHKVTECDAEALKAIVRNGYSEKQGARRMRNAAREAVQEAIREALLSGGETRGRLEYNGHGKSYPWPAAGSSSPCNP